VDHGGFYFTSKRGNATYYSEFWVARVSIQNAVDYPGDSDHPPTIMEQAIKDNAIYVVHDVVDGDERSDITVVPFSRLQDVKILKWEFSGNYDEADYFEKLDDVFDTGEDDIPITQEIIDGYIEATGGGLNYLLKQPVFKKYYMSKRVA
jgi:hypothetical protein